MFQFHVSAIFVIFIFEDLVLIRTTLMRAKNLSKYFSLTDQRIDENKELFGVMTIYFLIMKILF